MPATAAVLIIGEEILTGKFADENGPFLTRRLRELGVDLRRVVTLPDIDEEIAAEVARCAARYTWVVTTGGVGPTHDDRTFPAVALGLGLPLERHPEIVTCIQEKLGPLANEDAMRMADVPRGAQLWWEGGIRYPLVVARNVIILPGVPALARLKFDASAWRLQGEPVRTARLSTRRTEPEIARSLTLAADRWPQIGIGSYPRFGEGPPFVLVTMEGRDDAALSACAAWLKGEIGGDEA